MRRRVLPDAVPRYGYVMTDNGELVGILLLIFSVAPNGERRGNVSSWYVKSGYRSLSHILLAAPSRLKDATLTNISPAPTTFATIEAQGFKRYVTGAFIAVTAASSTAQGATIRAVTPHTLDAASVLTDHAGWGCLSFEVSCHGERHPFIFVARRVMRGLVPCAQLVFCRDVGDFIRFAGLLGRHLLRHGLYAILVDANSPLSGVPGTFRLGRSPKFFRGAAPPRLGDLSYTELAIFGP